MMANPKYDPCTVVTGRNTKFSYLTINQPKIPLGGNRPKYSASLIIPKSDTVTVEKIRAAIQAAYEEGQYKLMGKSKIVPRLEDLKTPLRDGDKVHPDDEAYRNCWFLSASNYDRPVVVDADRNPILDSSELYSGIIGRASITFFAFYHDVNKGIACGLNGLQKLADGTPLGNRRNVAEDFDDD